MYRFFKFIFHESSSNLPRKIITHFLFAFRNNRYVPRIAIYSLEIHRSLRIIKLSNSNKRATKIKGQPRSEMKAVKSCLTEANKSKGGCKLFVNIKNIFYGFAKWNSKHCHMFPLLRNLPGMNWFGVTIFLLYLIFLLCAYPLYILIICIYICIYLYMYVYMYLWICVCKVYIINDISTIHNIKLKPFNIWMIQKPIEYRFKPNSLLPDTQLVQPILRRSTGMFELL